MNCTQAQKPQQHTCNQSVHIPDFDTPLPISCTAFELHHRQPQTEDARPLPTSAQVLQLHAATVTALHLTVIDEEGVPQLHILLRLAQWEALAVPAQQHVTQWPCLNRLVQDHLQSHTQQSLQRELVGWLCCAAKSLAWRHGTVL